MNTIHTILPIQFSYLFDEPTKRVTDYLKLIPREVAVRYALLISNYTDNVDWKIQLNSLRLHDLVKGVCEAKMRIHESEFPGEQYVLFTPLTGLELLKYIFTIPVSEHHQIGHIWQGNLIKAIALVNTELLGESPRFNDESLNRFSKSVKHFKYELDDRVLVYAAVYRSMCLLEFLETESSDVWKSLLSNLTKQKGFKVLKDYIKRKLYLLVDLNLNPKRSNQIYKFKKDLCEIQKDAIPYTNEIKSEDNRDYTKFKEIPFVQIRNRDFCVIRNSFVANLIFNNLKFKLKDIYVNIRKGNAQEFFGIFNKDFIEKFLFLRIIKYSFNSCKYICFSEDECAKRLKEYKQMHNRAIGTNYTGGLMDGYVRCGNKILLLECKAKIISLRALSDEEQLKKDLMSDIVGQKGTGQLIDNCERIIQNECYWDKAIPKDYVIYPLLVFDDIGFSADGFNRYVIESTKECIDKYKGAVYHFTALDIDTFILFSELIRKNRLDIFREIENYHTHIRNSTFDKKGLSFATYLRAKFETKSPVSRWLKQHFS